MHPNSIYRQLGETDALALAGQRGFGVVTAQLDILFGAHVPFVLDGEERLLLHLHRGNALAKAVRAEPLEVMVIVSLCDAYVSPEWYGLGPDQVPTWLYGAVHLHGLMQALPDQELEPLLARLTEEFEGRLAPKPPWTLDKMGDAPKAALMRAIQPFEILLDGVEATDKFAQNKPPTALDALAERLPQSFGAGVDQVAERVQRAARRQAG